MTAPFAKLANEKHDQKVLVEQQNQAICMVNNSRRKEAPAKKKSPVLDIILAQCWISFWPLSSSWPWLWHFMCPQPVIVEIQRSMERQFQRCQSLSSLLQWRRLGIMITENSAKAPVFNKEDEDFDMGSVYTED